MAQTHRKVHFLKVVSEQNNFSELLERVDALEGSDIYSYLDAGGGGVFLRSLESRNDMYMGCVARLRMNRLPSLARQNERQTQQLEIDPDQGLAECTHFIYFAQSGILAIEYNHYGPRASTLEWHITAKINGQQGESAGISFQHIFDEATFTALSEGSELSLLKMAVPKEKIGNLSQFDPSIHAAFINAENFGNNGKVEISIRMAGAGVSRMPGPRLLGMIRRLPGEPIDTFNKLKASVWRTDEKVKVVDLLEGKFVVDVTVNTTGRGNEVNTVEIFREMREAYQLSRDDLSRMVDNENLN